MPIGFEIYREGMRLGTFEPEAAMALGPESVPIQGDITFSDGLLSIGVKDELPTGVALMWDVGTLGRFLMETTRLAPRARPFNLNIELARSRLMKIVQKMEDWNLFDFPRIEKFTTRFREAQMLFAEALGMTEDPAAASELADQSLIISVGLSEELAAFHSDLLINRRKAANGFAKHAFGCRVDPAVRSQAYREALTENFDYCVLPMSWRKLQQEEQRFDTDATDYWVESLAARRMPIIAGPLINLCEAEVPTWLFMWEHDFDTLRELAYEYVQKVVHRYRRAVPLWNVAAGLYTNNAFALSFEQTIELTRLLVTQVKNMLPSARTLITITEPFGEYQARAKTGVPPMLYAEMVAQAGINFEAFGVELEMGVPTPGSFVRDLFQISSMLDRFSALGRPVFLTAVTVPGRNTADLGDRSGGRLDPSKAGRWRRPWDPQLQAEWMEAVYNMALSKPFIESVAWGNLADIHPTIPGGGLFTDVMTPKPALERLQEMRKQFHMFAASGAKAPAQGP